eukprot:CAMPEP_0178993488 /NCGR_PEP_ID=MMETSP0795-20121207/6729_1 /TAXON_ID=88552 /ORGANISM="Amoebophrya sp., Strain Ameob2" /LENGTH=925 /DNA_ID=CAMNT_0020685549 /DNA_START=206 /DNA_END=2983 /DNA_ORIENTATION=+
MGADGGGALPPGVISEDFDDDSPAEAVFYYKESTSGTEDAGGSGATPAQKTSTPLELDLVRVPPPPAPSDRAGKDAAGGSVSSGTTPAADATAGTSMEAPSPTNGAKVSPLGNEEDGDASTSRDDDEPGPGDSDRERGNILDADLHEASPVTGPAVSSSSNFYEDFFYNNNELHDQEEAGGRDDPFPALQRDWYHTCKPRIHAWPPNLELPMRVFITVWNLHGKAPPRDFSTWIPHSLQNPSSMHHLYIVGTCESCQTINQAIFCRKRAKVQEFEQNFERFLNGWSSPDAASAARSSPASDALDEAGSYQKVAISSLGAIHLMAFAHKSIAQKIWDVRTLNCSTGFGNVVGNKGGVLLSLSVGASSFLFVVSHLPAHKSGYKKRTEAFERIMGHSRRYLKPANRMAPEQVTPVSSAAWQDNTDEIFESSCTARSPQRTSITVGGAAVGPGRTSSTSSSIGWRENDNIGAAASGEFLNQLPGSVEGNHRTEDAEDKTPRRNHLCCDVEMENPIVHDWWPTSSSRSRSRRRPSCTGSISPSAPDTSSSPVSSPSSSSSISSTTDTEIDAEQKKNGGGSLEGVRSASRHLQVQNKRVELHVERAASAPRSRSCRERRARQDRAKLKWSARQRSITKKREPPEKLFVVGESCRGVSFFGADGTNTRNQSVRESESGPKLRGGARSRSASASVRPTDDVNARNNSPPGLRGGRASRIHPVSEADLHDYVFFFGDLNFRLDISRDKADKHVALSEHARLLAADTLAPLLGRNLPPWARRSHAGDEDAEDDIPQRGDVDEQNTTRAATGSPHHLQDHLLLHHERPSWNQLTEMPIRFPPTYKIDAYTRLQYDSSKKRRVPAWTDRILFKPNANLVPLAYDAIFDQEQLFLSDHRPVFAQFAIKFADAQLRHHALGKQATAARKGTSSVCAIM